MLTFLEQPWVTGASSSLRNGGRGRAGTGQGGPRDATGSLRQKEMLFTLIWLPTLSSGPLCSESNLKVTRSEHPSVLQAVKWVSSSPHLPTGGAFARHSGEPWEVITIPESSAVWWWPHWMHPLPSHHLSSWGLGGGPKFQSSLKETWPRGPPKSEATDGVKVPSTLDFAPQSCGTPASSSHLSRPWCPKYKMRDCLRMLRASALSP